MDHPCYRCNHAVEDGIPFCAQCGAPQIRVMLPEPVSPTLSADAEAELPASIVHASSFGILWKEGLRACALAGAIVAVLLSLDLIVPVLGMLGVGFLAVALYHRRVPAALIKTGNGAQLGAVTGIVTFGIFAVFEGVGTVLLHAWPKVHDKLMEVIRQAAQRTGDPQAQAIFDYFKTPPGTTMLLLFIIIFSLIFFILFGAAGGALAGAWLGRRKRS